MSSNLWLPSSGFWLPPGVSHLAAREGDVEPDLRPFVRASQQNQTLATRYSQTLETWVQDQVSQAVDPNAVPLRALQAMGTHPVVYLAEQTITGLIRRPNLYYVSHPEKRIVKETEEWL